MVDTSSLRQEERPAGVKMLVQMSGAPCSGKSTTANMLGASLGAVVLDHDVLRSTILADDAIAFEQAAKTAYRLNWALAETFLKQGFSVIIDSTCNYQQILDEGMRLAKQYGYRYWYVECRTSDIELLDKRLQNRVPLRSQRSAVDSAPVDALGLRTQEESLARFKHWIDNPCRPAQTDELNIITVDSNGNLEERTKVILAQMASENTV